MPCRLSATHVQHAATHIFLQNRHVLWTGTTGLRSGQKQKKKSRGASRRQPFFLPHWPSAPPPSLNTTLRLQGDGEVRKNFCGGAVRDVLRARHYTGCGFHSSLARQRRWEKHTLKIIRAKYLCRSLKNFSSLSLRGGRKKKTKKTVGSCIKINIRGLIHLHAL